MSSIWLRPKIPLRDLCALRASAVNGLSSKRIAFMKPFNAASRPQLARYA